jgi:ACS family hexuronate transporter-like MFS transporter
MSFSTINENIGKYRWTICALVFFATTINYLDRNVLGLLKSTLAANGVFGADKANQELYYSYVVISFQIAYALGMTMAGRFIDWIGTKRGYAFSLIGWSFAAIGHAFGHTTVTFGMWRAALGFTEAGNFPAANKTMAEWFPKKERAFATGIYNSGANIGAIIAPLCVPWIAINWGWEWAFVLTGAVGLIWLIFWYKIYATPAEKLKAKILSQAEYDYIHSDKDEHIVKEGELEVEVVHEKISWFKLLSFRQTWAFVFGKFMTDPIWWFFMFWLPAYLNGENERKISDFMASNPNFIGDSSSIPGVISWPLAVAVVYSVSTLGSILGGWLPKILINRGVASNKARKYSMLIYAFFPLLVLLASRVGQISTWYAVFTIAIACAAHQAWSANIFTTVSDMFPKKAVATVTGIGGMAGAFGGILIAWAAGMLLKHFTALGKVELGYGIMFIICGVAYLAAWTVFNILAPKMKRVEL